MEQSEEYKKGYEQAVADMTKSTFFARTLFNHNIKQYENIDGNLIFTIDTYRFVWTKLMVKGILSYLRNQPPTNRIRSNIDILSKFVDSTKDV